MGRGGQSDNSPIVDRGPEASFSSSEVTSSGAPKGPSSPKIKSPSFPAFRPVFLKLPCAHKSPGGFDKRQILIGLGWRAEILCSNELPGDAAASCWPTTQVLSREA